MRSDLGGDLADAFFVRSVEVGIHQRHGDGLHTVVDEALKCDAYFGFVERANLEPFRVDPAARLDRVLERRQRLRLGPHDPAGQSSRNEAARDLHDLTVAIRDDQADARHLAFEHRIGRDGRTVQEHFDLRRLDARLRTDRLHADEDSDGAVERRRRGLVTPERCRPFIEQQKVRESAAHVHAQSECHRCLVWEGSALVIGSESRAPDEMDALFARPSGLCTEN